MDADEWYKIKLMLHSSQYSKTLACSDSIKELHTVGRQYCKIIATFRVECTSHSTQSFQQTPVGNAYVHLSVCPSATRD